MVLGVCLAVRADDGSLVDPGVLGVEGLIALIRAHPPGAPPAEYAVFGASVDVLETIEVVLGQVTALRAAAVHAVAEDTPAGVVADQVVDVLMMALNRSRRSGLYLREQALLLTHQPQVWAALWAGQLDVTKAGILARALYQVPRQDVHDRERPEYDADCERLLAAGMAYATEHTAGQLDRHLKRLLAADRPGHGRDPPPPGAGRAGGVDRSPWRWHRGPDRPPGLHARRAGLRRDPGRGPGRATRRLRGRRHRGHGEAAPAGPPEARCAGGVIRAVRCEAARRPFDLRMADALVDLILTPSVAPRSAGTAARTTRQTRRVSTGSAPIPGVGCAVSTQINVTIPIDSLAGLSDTPGTLSGFGVLPADLVRRLAAGDTRWRHILTDRATGAILDVGTWSYRPPTALDRHVRTRDVTCRFPGCTVPARECDLDHLIPFPEGPTSPDNLHSLCRRHHRLKHDDRWTVEPLPHSGLRWTSPLGTTRDTWPDTDHAHQEHTTAA